MKSNKKVLLVLASVVLAGILSGCNANNPSSNNPSSNNPTSSQVTSTEPSSSASSNPTSSEAPHTHTYGAWTITTAPTATETGTATRSCTDSDDTETATVPVLTDTSVWSVKSTTPATCEAAGSVTYTSTYGDVTVTLDALNHAYGAWTLVTNPTLETAGSAKRVCSNDATHVETTSVPALTDTSVWSVKSTTPATCTEDGNVVYTSTYGDVTVVVNATNHAYGEWSIKTAPTLEAAGSAEKVCANDQGHKETQTLPVLTDTSVWTVKNTVAPTCEAAGSVTYTSTYGDVTITTPATGHSYGNWEITAEPTETAAGTAKKVCANDATHVVTETIPALNDTSVWTVSAEVAPKCEVPGSKTYTSVYGNVTVEVASTGHKYGEWSIDVNPTLNEIGLASRVCEHDEDHYEEVDVPVLTDTSVWTLESDVKPTLEAAGSKTYTSTYGTVTVEVPALSNTGVWAVETTPATCDEDGVSVYTSSLYGTVEVVLPKTNHAYGEWEITVEPTETATGTAVKVCANADHPLSQTIPVLTDTSVWTVEEHVDATDLVAGYTIYSSEYGEVRVDHPANYGQWTLPEGDIELGSTVVLTKASLTGGTDKTVEVKVPSSITASEDVLFGENNQYKLENTSSNYGFEYDEATKTFVSNNNGVGGSYATMTFTAKKSGTLTFTVYCKAEGSSWDIFYLNETSNKCGSKDGETKEYSITLSEGETCTLNYKKDGSGDHGDDEAVVSNLVFSYEGEKEFAIVEFITENGEVAPVITGKGNSCVLPEAFKEGYKLEGWYDVTLTTKYDNNSAITGYTYMYPKWEIGYTVTAHIIGTESVKYTEFIGTPVTAKNPTNLGYVFDGWYTTSTCDEGTEWNPSANTETSMDIYAKWVNISAIVGEYSGYEVYGLNSTSYNPVTINIDENGNITGKLTGTVVAYDLETGVITWKENGNDTSYVLYYKDGVVFAPYSKSSTTLGKDFYVVIKDFEYTNVYNSSFMDAEGQYTNKLISFVDASSNIRTVFVSLEGIYMDVTVSSLKNDVTGQNAYNHADVVIKDSQGQVLLTKAFDGSNMVDVDSAYGIYTNGEEELVVHGAGKFTYQDKQGSYVINSETNIVEAYVYEDGVATEYLEFTLDGETFSVNKPMVNINVVISEGNTNTTSVNKNLPIAELETPELENHRFDGWYSDEACTVAFDFTAPVTTETSIYAKWVRQYSVTIYGDDGETVWVSEKVDVNTDYTPTLPAEFASGKNIVGYFLESTFENEWTEGSPITEDLVIYVKTEDLLSKFVPTGVVSEFVCADDVTNKIYAWNIVASDGKATFTSSNGAVGNSKSYSKFTLAKNSILSFDYVVGSESNYDKLIVKINGTDKLTVSGENKVGNFNYKLSANDVVEIYYSKDGSGDKNGDTVTLTNLKFTDGYPSTTITYVYNDGVTVDGTGSIDYLGTLTEEHLQAPENVRDAESYNFGGWYLDEEFELEATTDTIANDENITLYARWLEKVTVSFVVPEGVTAIEDVNAWTYTAIEVAKPSLAGHMFRGWYADSEYTTPVDLTNGVSETITLYAKFEAVPVGSSMDTADVITIENNTYVKENATTTEEFYDYYFKLVVEATDKYYFLVNNAKYVGGNGTYTNTNYGRFRILNSEGEVLEGTSTLYSLNKYYNDCAVELTPGTYYVHVNLALHNPSAIVYGTFNMNVATAQNDTVETAIELTVNGETLTSSQIDRTYVIYKFAVEAGNSYNVTGSKSADIYSDAELKTKVVSIPWAGATKTIEATEDGFFYIRTMYTGVSFSVSSIELDCVGNKIFKASYSCDCYYNSTCTTKFTFDGSGNVSMNISCVDSDGYGNYHGGTTNGTYSIDENMLTIIAGGNTIVFELDNSDSPTKLVCVSTTMDTSSYDSFAVGTEFTL